MNAILSVEFGPDEAWEKAKLTISQADAAWERETPEDLALRTQALHEDEEIERILALDAQGQAQFDREDRLAIQLERECQDLTGDECPVLIRVPFVPITA